MKRGRSRITIVVPSSLQHTIGSARCADGRRGTGAVASAVIGRSVVVGVVAQTAWMRRRVAGFADALSRQLPAERDPQLDSSLRALGVRVGRVSASRAGAQLTGDGIGDDEEERAEELGHGAVRERRDVAAVDPLEDGRGRARVGAAVHRARRGCLASEGRTVRGGRGEVGACRRCPTSAKRCVSGPAVEDGAGSRCVQVTQTGETLLAARGRGGGRRGVGG